LFLTRSVEAVRFQVDRQAVELFLRRDVSEFPKKVSDDFLLFEIAPC
jgi:hypothetical protein